MNQNQITVINNIVAHSDKVAYIVELVSGIVPKVAGKDGNIQYAFNQDEQDPTNFMLIEVWESKEVWQAHMEAMNVGEALKDPAIKNLKSWVLHTIAS